jgi:SdrD B-like domain
VGQESWPWRGLLLVVLLGGVLAGLFGGTASAASTLGICTAGGGTLGTNLFTNDGTFGTLSGTPANPTWSAALPAGRTTLTYVNNTTRTTPYVGSPEDGEYVISNSTAFRTDGAWWNVTDHSGATGGAVSGNLKGQMMVINADFNPDVFYTQTLTVTPYTNYEYGLWIMNLLKNPGINPNIQVEVDHYVAGVKVSTDIVAASGDIAVSNPAVWKAFGAIVNSGDATTMVVRFVNKNPGGGGNDLAIDDLTFTPCSGLSVGSLSGTAYLDNNRNNTLDALSTDTALAGVTVQVINTAGVVVTSTTTSSTGFYQFKNIQTGSYTVRVLPGDPNVNATYVATAPSGASRSVNLSSGAFLLNQDYGYQQGVDVQALKAQRLGTSGTFAATDLTGVPRGSVVQFQLTFKNAGTIAVTTSSNLTDPIPAGFTAPSLVGAAVAAAGATGCSAALAGNTVTLTAATLPVGASCVVTVQVTASTVGTFANKATANPPTGIPDYATGNNAATVNTVVLAPPSVTLVKKVRNVGKVGAVVTTAAYAAASSGKPGEVSEYCIDYSNAAGVQAARNVVLSDPLPILLVTAWADGYGTGLGLQWTRVLSGVSTTSTLTSAAADDAGDLGGNVVLRVGSIAAGDSGSICFRAIIK